jgi:hypothetical protein
MQIHFLGLTAEEQDVPLEGMLRDIIEVAIAWAELMSKDTRSNDATKTAGVAMPGKSFLSQFRCVVNLHVNAGPITPDEKTSNSLMVDKGSSCRVVGRNSESESSKQLRRHRNDAGVIVFLP